MGPWLRWIPGLQCGLEMTDSSLQEDIFATLIRKYWSPVLLLWSREKLLSTLYFLWLFPFYWGRGRGRRGNRNIPLSLVPSVFIQEGRVHVSPWESSPALCSQTLSNPNPGHDPRKGTNARWPFLSVLQVHHRIVYFQLFSIVSSLYTSLIYNIISVAISSSLAVPRF